MIKSYLHKMTYLLILVILFCPLVVSSIEFPIKEVFKQPPMISIVNGTFIFNLYNHRDELFLCSGTTYKCCDCTATCMKTQTCCIDYLWDSSVNITTASYLKKFIAVSKTYKDVTCQLPIRNTSMFGKNPHPTSYYMVSGCMNNVSDSYKRFCMDQTSEQLSLTNPVLGEDNYIYRNSYCALCNNIYNFELLEYFSSCYIKDNITSLNPNASNLEFCSVRLLFPKDSPSTDWECDVEYIDEKKCSKDNPYYQLCNSFKGKIENKGKYKNIFCYLCIHNGATYPNLTCMFDSKTPITHSLSQTLSYRKNRIEGSQLYRYSKAYSCNENEIYNFNSQKCEELECPLDKSKCTDIKIMGHTAGNYNTTSCFGLYNFITIKVKTKGSKLKRHLEILNLTKEEVEIYTFSNVRYVQSKSKVLEHYLKSYVYFILNSHNQTESISLYLTMNKQVLTNFYKHDVVRTFSNSNICADLNNTFSYSNNLTTCYRGASFEKETSWIVIDNGYKYKVKSYCTNFHMKNRCNTFGFSNEYKMDSDKVASLNDIIGRNIILSAQHYIPMKNGIAYCLDGIKLKHREEINDLKEFEYYLSLTGSCLSILCYVLVIATFMYYKILHALPTYNNIGICIMLLLSDLLFLIATQAGTNKKLCTSVAVLLHYTLLSVQCWVIVISIDITLKVCQLKPVNKSLKVFRYYCIFALLTPLLVVLTLFILDNTNALSMDYGNKGFCWINNFLLRLITYIIPAMIVFIVIFILLVLNIYKIKKIKDETSKMTGGNNYSELVYIALKIVVLLGLTEVVGFIQIQHDNLSINEEIFNSSFSILYAFVRSFRGCFFAVMFLFNKRTYNLYRETASSYSIRPSSSSESNKKASETSRR